MIRRHPILFAFLLLALVSGAIFAYALATFDLDNYRGGLQNRLSADLGRPVRLGKAALSLRRGPAVSFSELQIGTAGDQAELTAGRLLMRLDWASLLQGKLAFARILLERPRLLLNLERSTGETSFPDLKALGSLSIRSLTVEDGSLRLSDRRTPQRPQTLELEGIEAEITDLAAGRPAWLRLGARVRQGKSAAPVTLVGEVVPPASSAAWGQTEIKVGLIVNHIAPASFLEPALGLPDGTVFGKGRLRLSLDGSPDTGLRFQADLAGPNQALKLPGHGKSIPIPELRLEGNWTAGSDHIFRNLKLQTGALALEGELMVGNRDGSSWLEAGLTTPPLPITKLLDLLPAESEKPALGRMVTGGTLQVRQLRFSGPAAALRDPAQLSHRLSGEFILAGGTASLPDIGPVTESAVTLRLQDDLLLLEEGRTVFWGTPATFSGAVERPFEKNRELLLEAEAELPSEKVLPLLPIETQRELHLSGSVPALLGLTGKDGLLRVDLRADLQQMEGRWKSVLEKKPGQAARLFLTGDLTPEEWKLDFARLRLDSMEIRGRGAWQRTEAEDLTLQIDLAVSDLASARAICPPLGKIRAEGEGRLNLEISRTEGLYGRQGVLTLHDAGFHITPAIADLRKVNGTLRLAGDRIESGGLSAHLGTSPITVVGSLINFSDPRIELRVRGRSIRASDIIFPSHQAMLRDVDGKLIIDGRQIAFTPVSVRLDGGTRAVVEGAVRFEGPAVDLDIRAEHGNIDEVIALWAGPEAPQAEKGPDGEEPKEENNTTVRITALADRGTLGNLHFQRAEGLITWQRGVLAIHPLHFRSGQGYCVGRVQVEGGPLGSWLSASGHLENFDAAQIYSEMLERQGLVSGTLRGDFFLEGLIGGFKSTSRGGVSLEVDRGVLRKFNSLAKVFSLLNISQILSLQLPDMARDGMPFNRLTATVAVKGGILRTDDLFMDSHAMNLSLVGNLDLNTEKLDLVMGLKPLRTVDKIVTKIPLAGWLLTGEEKALITAHFLIRGAAGDPEVVPVPITSLSEKAVGIFRRALGLPGRMVENVGQLIPSGD